MSRFSKFFGKKKKGKKKQEPKRNQAQDSDSDDEFKSVQIDESSNHVTEIPAVSSEDKKKMWHDKNDLMTSREEVQNENSIERTREKVREAVQNEMGAFATSRKVEKRVQQVMRGSPQEIGEYLQQQGVSMTASPAEMEEKIRNMVKNKLITDRSRNSFSTTQVLDRKVDAVMGLDREDILDYLELEEDSSLISPEWRKDEQTNQSPDLQSLSSSSDSSSSLSSFGAAPNKKSTKRSPKNSPTRPTAKKKPPMQSLLQRSPSQLSFSQPLPNPEGSDSDASSSDDFESQKLSFSQPLSSKDSDSDGSTEHPGQLEVPTKTTTNGGPTSKAPATYDSDDSFSKKCKSLSGLSRTKSREVVSMEEAMNREGVDDYLKDQILKVMEEKNRGIESLEEALNEANNRYLTLKNRQRNFLAVQEELEALALDQERKLDIMTRKLEKVKENEKGLDKDERAQKEHFARLKAKDVLNESLREQLKTREEAIQEKDKTISMLQQKLQSPSEDSKDKDEGGGNKETSQMLEQKLEQSEEKLQNTESKLETTQDELDEANAIIEELKKELKDDNLDANDKDLKAELTEARSTIRDLERKLKKEESQRSTAEESLKEAQNKTNGLERKVKMAASRQASEKFNTTIVAEETAEEELARLKKKMDDDLEEKEEELVFAQSRISALETELKRAKTTGESATDGLSSDQKDAEIKNLQEQLEDLERDLRYTVKDRDKKWNEKDEEIERLKEELARMQSARETEEPATSSNLDSKEAKIKSLQEALDKSKEEADESIENLENTVSELQNQIKKQMEQNKEENQAAGSADQVAELKGKLEKETARANDLQGELESLQDQRKSLRGLLNKRTSAVESTEKVLKEHEAMMRSLQREIANQKTESEKLRTAPKLDTPDSATLQADLDITKEDLREAKKSLKLEKASNEKAKLALLSMENDLENRMEEVTLMEKQLELSSMLQGQVDQLKKSLERNRHTIESQASQINSLQEELGMRAATVSRGDLGEILEAAKVNSELEKEQTALKKAKKRITKLESDLKKRPEMTSDGKSVSDLQQQLDHQMRISELLAEQLETSKASIESKTGVIDSMKQELGDKQQHIRSLEAALKKKRKSGSSNSQASDNTAAIQRRIRKELEEEIYDLQRRLRKEQSMHRKSKNKITKLEDELDDQLADWVALENEMDETKAYLAEIESQLAKEEAKKRNLERKEKEEEKAQVKEKGKKEKKPRRSSVSASNSGEDFNLYLDSLTRKVREARNQLETAHGRLDQAVSRHRIANREPVYSA